MKDSTMSKVKVNMKDVKLGKQEVLQAVVIGSDFTRGLEPMQDLFPTVLTPVANFYLLDYLLETLKHNGVQEVFIYCCNHIDAIKSYTASKNAISKNLTISLIISDGCQSIGDALRDIDNKGWIRGDFILIRGDAFTNATLANLMTQHRARRERDKGTAMTLILRDIGSTRKSIFERDSCVFLAKKHTKRLLFYKKIASHERKVEFESEWFSDHDEIEINSGFIDTHVYICSPSFLPLFSDNFDFQTIEDFIRGILMNEEILDSRIYWQELNSDEYAMPMVSWPAYHILTRDILQRQSWPLTPDMLCPKSGIIYTSRNTYKHHTAIFEGGSILKRDTIIGEKCSLGKKTTITGSVLGKNCLIGQNVVIENSYIFEGVTIKNNCILRDCTIFSNCYLNESTNLDSCIVLPEINLPERAKYNNSILKRKDNDEIVCDSMTDMNESDINEFIYFKKLRDEDEDETYDSDDTRSDRSSITADSQLPDDADRFLSEVIDSLLRGYQEKLNCDNLILEINSSRYAYNVSIREVTYNVVKAIFMLPIAYFKAQNEEVTNVGYQKVLRVMIIYFDAILLNYIKTENAQEDCLKAFDAVANTTKEFIEMAKFLMVLFYEKDLLSEEKILQWYNRRNHNSNDDDDEEEDDDDDINENEELYNEEIRAAIKPLIVWLNEAEEETSSNEDD